jgi:predicted kinase
VLRAPTRARELPSIFDYGIEVVRGRALTGRETNVLVNVMVALHIVLGPVGSGKSTYAADLARTHRAVRLTLDDWMMTLFRADRPDVGVMDWYLDRSRRCLEQIWKVTDSSLGNKVAVVLEVGLVQRRERTPFLARIDASGFPHVLYVLDAPRSIRRARVLKRNQEKGPTYSMDVPAQIFEMASDLWEPLTEAERTGRDVRDIVTG